jgi:hypothetical protein
MDRTVRFLNDQSPTPQRELQKWQQDRLREMELQRTTAAVATLIRQLQDGPVTPGQAYQAQLQATTQLQAWKLQVVAANTPNPRQDAPLARGKSKMRQDVRIAGWTAQRMSKTQIQFVDSLGYDVVF